MPLHIALLEAIPAPAAGRVARRCAETDASLHLIGPLTFDPRDREFLDRGPKDWDKLDWWVHPDWGDFRAAITRERCLYFAADGQDFKTAPLRANSVLVFGDESLALPDKIRGKYPDRIFRIPSAPKGEKHPLQWSVARILVEAEKRLKAESTAILAPVKTASRKRSPARKAARPG